MKNRNFSIKKYKILSAKTDTFTNYLTPQQIELNRNDTKPITEYVEKHLWIPTLEN